MSTKPEQIKVKPAAEAAPGRPAVAENGTAEQAAQAARAPVVIDEEAGPIVAGGPGAGAAQSAEVREGFASRPLHEGLVAEVRVSGALTDAERLELAALRREKARGLVVDAAALPGRRLAQATTAIKRDGVLYAPDGPDQWVPVDFQAFAELRQIGAITDTPWDQLERAEV